MIKAKQLITAILIVILASSASGQVIIEDEKSTPSVFAEGNSKKKKKEEITTLRGVLHYGWLQMVRGRFPLFYEHGFSSHFSGSIGLGLAHTDFFNEDHTVLLFDSEKGKMKTGWHGEALLKFYPQALAIENLYIGLNGRYSRFNLEKFELDYTNIVSEHQTEYLILFGTQYHETGQALVFDYYCGIGASSKFSTTQELVNIGGTYSPISIATVSPLKVIFRIGVKIGLKLY